MIGCCQQAPYGKGTHTLVDTTVRRVWELDTEHFQLSNPKWDQLIESIVAEVQGKLGLQERKLTAQLYKLLVYEKESFFLPHRDGEKMDRMALNKERRRHLHEIIGSNRCDLTHVTERRGSPFTQVCTKTTSSYARASSIYERDLKNLSRIMDLEKGGLLRC